MSATRTVAVLVGSLRKESFNRKMANALIAIAPASLKLTIHEIGQLPLYNQDLDTATPPVEWKAFRDGIRSVDALLFVTPEYNRSGQSVYNGKPAGVISVSPGAIGGFAANHALRQSFVFLNVPVMQQPEAYIGNAAKLFDDQGKLTDDSTRDFLKKFLQAFTQWIENNAPK